MRGRPALGARRPEPAAPARLRRLALLAAVAPLAVGCGGSTVSAQEFMDDVCKAIVKWQRVLADAPPGDPANAAEAQQVLAGYLDGAATSTQQLADAIENAGTPDIESGDRLAQELRDGFNGIASDIGQAAKDVEGLSPESSDFGQRYAEITATLGKAVTDAGESFGKIESKYDPKGELEKASQDVASCKDVSG